MARAGMRAGNPAGKNEAVAIYAQVDADNPGAVDLPFTPQRDDIVYHLVMDAVDIRHTEQTTFENVPQDARDHIQVFEVSPNNRDEDCGRVGDAPLDQVEWGWDGDEDVDYYDFAYKASGGDYNDARVLPGGLSEYKVVTGDHTDDTYTGRVRAYDAAGNSSSGTDDAVVSAAPEPPSDTEISTT